VAPHDQPPPPPHVNPAPGGPPLHHP
jgi:hypothetical protein